MDLFALNSTSLEALQALEHGIETGRGGVWLKLAEERVLNRFGEIFPISILGCYFLSLVKHLRAVI